MSIKDEEWPQFSEEEIEAYYASIDESFWKVDETVPHWLWLGESLAYSESAFEISRSRELSQGIKNAFIKLRAVVEIMRKAFENEAVGEISEKVFRDYYNAAENEWASAVSFQDINLKAVKKKLQQGHRRGHAAFGDNWQKYWDDKWLERRTNNKGWQYSANDILNELPSNIVIPDQSTISRYRNKLYKEIRDK